MPVLRVVMSHLSRASDSAVIVVTWARMVVMFASPRVISLHTVVELAAAPQPIMVLLQPKVMAQPAMVPIKVLLLPVVLQ